MFSAVTHEVGKLASSGSERSLSTAWTLRTGAAVYSAKPPSHSEPKYPHRSRSWGALQSRSHGSIRTRRPSSDESASLPTAATIPQTSAPCTLGKEIAQPLHAASASTAPGGASPVVASAPPAEYHAVRVLTSVLLSPQAPTRTSTWSGPARGSGQSSRYCSRSRPPCAVRTTARMTAGRFPGECHAAMGAVRSDTIDGAPGLKCAVSPCVARLTAGRERPPRVFLNRLPVASTRQGYADGPRFPATAWHRWSWLKSTLWVDDLVQAPGVRAGLPRRDFPSSAPARDTPSPKVGDTRARPGRLCSPP